MTSRLPNGVLELNRMTGEIGGFTECAVVFVEDEVRHTGRGRFVKHGFANFQRLADKQTWKLRFRDSNQGEMLNDLICLRC